MNRKIFLYSGLPLLLMIHLLILKTITFTAWPEMFSYPYLINKEFLIYRDFAHPYAPILTFILAFYYKLAGVSLSSHQYFTWAIILINDLLIFFIAKKFLKNLLILVPLIIYIFLQPIFEGNMLWFDLATTPFILGSFLSFLYIKNIQRRLFWFGFLLILAVLIKQQTIILLGLLTLILVFTKETRRKIGYFFLGLAIPLAFTSLIIFTLKIFNDYLFWTIIFPLVWLPKFPGYADLPTTKNIFLLFLIFGFPASSLARNYFKIDITQKFLLASIIAAVIMAFPRFSYFHLQPALVVLAIFIASLLKKPTKPAIFFLGTAIFFGIYLWKDYRPFIGVQSARFYDVQEFELAEFIKQNTTQNQFMTDKVYFLGPHSLHYVLSDKIPPKPWIDNYVWHFEIPGMQERQIEGIKREEHLVIFKQGPSQGNWYDLGVYQPGKIIDYIDNNFELVNTHKSGIEVWKKKELN